MSFGLISDPIINEDNSVDILDLTNENELQDDILVNKFSEVDESVNLDELECEQKTICENGILTTEVIKEGLTNLGKTPDGMSYAMLTLKLMGYELQNVDELSQYPRLQEVNLSHNQLCDINFVEVMQNLISLNVSNNLLVTLPDTFTRQSVNFLREIDFSFNQIEEIPDLEDFRFLTKINFHHNKLSDLSALNNCRRLTWIDISNNSIRSLKELETCCSALKYIDASHNSISSLNGLEMASRLQELLVSGNSINSMDMFTEHHIHRALYKIDLENNCIIDIEQLRTLQSLYLLRDLNLRHNPITEVPDYRLHVLLTLPILTHLDGSKIDTEEKVQAVNIFTPSLEVLAARDHRINMVNRFFKAHTVLYSTLQNSFTPYPMLILVGPKGSCKKWLARKLVREIPNFFGLAMSHTTAPPRHNYEEFEGDYDYEEGDDEGDSRRPEYYHVSRQEFERMRLDGSFLETCQIEGHQYGLSMDAVESIAREGLACVLHLELEGVASLKRTHFEPRYVLTLPLNRVIQEVRIRDSAKSPVALDTIVKNAVAKTEMYLEKHRSCPGYFDKFICTDNLEEAFVNLKNLVMDYLGITNEYVEESRMIDANSRLASIGNLSQSRATESQPKVSSSGSAYTAREGVPVLEQKSIERRIQTARSAVFKKPSQDDSISAIKMICRTRSYEMNYESNMSEEEEEEERNIDMDGFMN